MGEARLCVLCRTRQLDERWRPFCSERCRNEDLAQWADGGYRIASEPLPDPDHTINDDLDPD
jgi:endogenous inhibitor of DNA gyrase (YacG/DUF329 family)